MLVAGHIGDHDPRGGFGAVHITRTETVGHPLARRLTFAEVRLDLVVVGSQVVNRVYRLRGDVRRRDEVAEGIGTDGVEVQMSTRSDIPGVELAVRHVAVRRAKYRCQPGVTAVGGEDLPVGEVPAEPPAARRADAGLVVSRR